MFGCLRTYSGRPESHVPAACVGVTVGDTDGVELGVGFGVPLGVADGVGLGDGVRLADGAGELLGPDGGGL
jgi:hypothetical protein